MEVIKVIRIFDKKIRFANAYSTSLIGCFGSSLNLNELY